MATPAVSNNAPVFASETLSVAANDKIPAGATFGAPVTATEANDHTITYSLEDDATSSAPTPRSPSTPPAASCRWPAG